MAIWGAGLSLSSVIYIIYVLTILQERTLSAISGEKTIADKVRSCT